MKKLLSSLFAVSLVVSITGCYTRETITVNTPAVYALTGSTNVITPAKTVTTVTKARLFLPDGYALLGEEDVYGFAATLSSYSSTFPNVKLGLNHSTFRLIPTSTNAIYAPNISEAGGLQNKAVPFWFGLNGQFASGNAYVNQGSGTNSAITSTAVIPATGATH